MYVIKKDDGKTYVLVRDGKTYVSTISKTGTTTLTIYTPDGALVKSATITINNTSYKTDANGKVTLTGTYDKPVTFSIVYNTNYRKTISTKYGTNSTVNLEQHYLLTVTATGFTGSTDATVTTTIGSAVYTGSQSIYVKKGTSVTVAITCGYYYYGSYVKVDGTSTSKASYTFTMDKAHTITFTNGTYYDPNSGGT